MRYDGTGADRRLILESTHGRKWLRRALATFGVLVALTIVGGVSRWFTAKPALGGRMDDARLARYQQSPQWRDGKFRAVTWPAGRGRRAHLA